MKRSPLLCILWTLLLVPAPLRAADSYECNLLANGSMEFWSRYDPNCYRVMLAENPPFDNGDPLVPTRWSCGFAKPTVLRQVKDAHGGQFAIAISSPKLARDGSLSIGFVELNPGSSYTFGVWAKGSGKVTVRLYGKAYEGDQELASVTEPAGAQWKNIGGKIILPTHIRLVRLVITLPPLCELVLDDAYVSALLDKPYDADAVLTQKYCHDLNTLIVEDFETQSDALTLSGKSHLTDEHGGRFGRGLRVDKPDFATLRLQLSQMPKEGTLEFWISPDHTPPGPGAECYLAVCAGSEVLGRLHAWPGSLFWGWPRADGKGSNYIEAPADLSVRRLRQGQWMHVAFTWDSSAVRSYEDGVLVDLSLARKGLWEKTPTNMIVGGQSGPAMWNGVIDEIRLSKVRRYGPIAPKGDKLVELAPVDDSAAQAGAGERPKPTIDIATERAKLLGTLAPSRPGEFQAKPTPDGDFVYEAESAKPLVDDIPFAIQKDSPAKGLTVVRLLGARNGGPTVLDNSGMYWRLGALQTGKYWLGVTYESQDNYGREAPAPRLGAYLNGRIIQCSTLSDPVQVAPGKWFSEVQAAAPETLKEGDEISFVAYWQEARVLRMTLHTREPARGENRVAINFGGDWGNLYTAQGINACAVFVNAKGEPFVDNGNSCPEQRAASAKELMIGADGKAIAFCYLANPLPVSVTVDYQCEVKGYYRYLSGRDKGQLTLNPHSRIKREVKFSLDAAAINSAYSIETRIKAVEAPDLGWPEADTVSFFPGLRQSVPWPDAMQYRDLKRVVFDEVPGTSQSHGFISLSDGWEAALTADLDPPVPAKENLKYAPRNLPVWFDLTTIEPRPHSVYLHKVLELPASAKNRAYRLCVCDPTDEATLYVNGKKVGAVKGGCSLLFADVTDALKPGRNDLIVIVRDLMAIMDPAYVNPKAPTPSANYLDAPGLYSSERIGLAKVWMESMPLVSVQDVQVIPSVRKKTITVRATVVNRSDKAARIIVFTSMRDGPDVAMRLENQIINLEPGKSREITTQQNWPNPRLWSPADPHLYVAEIDVRGANEALEDHAVTTRSTELFDTVRTRFGFCESWMDGPNIRFNGMVVKLKGSGTPSPLGLGIRNDFNLARNAHVCDRIGMDYLDEWGCTTSLDITGIWNSPSKHNVDRDAFWQNATKNMLTSARYFQNHPSIIAWDLSNEWLWYYDYASPDGLTAARRFQALSDTLIAQDPSRWSLFDGDADLRGLHDNFSFHYMNPYYYGDLEGHSIYHPDGAFWGSLDKGFNPEENIPVNVSRKDIILRPDMKVVMDSEYLWKTGRLMPPGLTRFVGEDDVLSPAVDSGAGPIAWFWKTELDGHRDAGTSMICYYGGVTATSRRGYLLQTFLVPDLVHHGFSGQTLTRRFTLLNDVFASATLNFQWQLLGPDGKARSHDGLKQNMTSGELRRGTLAFKLPEVDKRTTFVLDLRLTADGKFVCGEQRDIEVWPNKPTVPALAEEGRHAARELFLYDPKGKTAETFKAMVNFHVAAALAPPQDPHAVLIIGEGALDSTTAPQVMNLAKFVEDGGRVLILAQTVGPLGLPAATRLAPHEWASQCFPAVPDHPILKGVTDWDLHFWAPRRDVGRGAYTRPNDGPATPLVWSGETTGMEWVQMMELYRGKGLYLLCQLPLIAKYNDEPMARELLCRTLEYLAQGNQYRTPCGRFEAVVDRGGVVEKKLADAGVAYEVLAPGSPVGGAGHVVLIDASMKVDDAARKPWARALRAGATVVVCNALPADATWLSQLAGQTVSITVPRYYMWGGRGCRTCFEQPIAGISQADLYWKQYEEAEAGANQAEDPRYTIEPLQDFAVGVEGARELVYPGALVQLKVGGGTLLIDQRRWMTTHEKLLSLANRNLAAMALGVGVQIAPVVVPRTLPANVAHQTIDLSPFCNRSLSDDVADDGKGGWTDQGPKADLRTLATGEHNFQGVPFVIGKDPRSCIVLSSDARPHPENLPAEVTIPLGQTVEGLCFLHGFAYTSSGTYAGLYQVQYADGTTADIPLYGETNARDWISAAGPFARERGTTSSVAWTGSCPMFRQIVLYKMLWVNPRPQVPIKAVRFANPSRAGVPVLLGLTAVVPHDAKPAQPPAALQKARDLLATALQAVQDHRDTKAQELLRDAIAADPSLTAAHQALADLCERAGNEDAALGTYQAWAKSGARTPLPYNRIGQILEKRKDYKAALEAYTKSLQVEWNQPPTIEAKARLEKLLNQK